METSNMNYAPENGNKLVIQSLMDVEIAIMEGNDAAMKTYIDLVDRVSANQMMRHMAEHFGFPVVEVAGSVRTSAGQLARVFGYKNPHGIIQLLDRWGIYGIKVGGFTHDVCIQIKQVLNLSDNDNSSILLDYPAFLVAGLNSTNEEAKQVHYYFMRCERIARIAVIAIKNGLLPGQDDAARVRGPRERILLLQRVDGMKPGPLRELALDELEIVLGKKIDRPKQGELPFGPEAR